MATPETPSLCLVLGLMFCGPWGLQGLLSLQVIPGPSDQPDMEMQLGSRQDFQCQIRTYGLEHNLVRGWFWSINHYIHHSDHLWETQIYWF